MTSKGEATVLADTVPATALLPLSVTVVKPDGSVGRVVRCRTADECLEVVEGEAASAPTWTMLLVTRESGGAVKPVARWAVGPRGLSRLAYTPNAGDDMERLIRVARNAYVHGQMDKREVHAYLMEKYAASSEQAFLAAAAGRILAAEAT